MSETDAIFLWGIFTTIWLAVPVWNMAKSFRRIADDLAELRRLAKGDRS